MTITVKDILETFPGSQVVDERGNPQSYPPIDNWEEGKRRLALARQEGLKEMPKLAQSSFLDALDKINKDFLLWSKDYVQFKWIGLTNIE